MNTIDNIMAQAFEFAATTTDFMTSPGLYTHMKASAEEKALRAAIEQALEPTPKEPHDLMTLIDHYALVFGDERNTAEARRDVVRALGLALEDRDELRELSDKLADILKRTAIAIRGPEPELTSWGWHDLPERVEQALAARVPDVDALRDHLVAISTCVADQDHIGAQAMLGDVLRMLAAAPQPAQQAEWVGLSDEDLSVCDADGVILARYWETKLREKNGGV